MEGGEKPRKQRIIEIADLRVRYSWDVTHVCSEAEQASWPGERRCIYIEVIAAGIGYEWLEAGSEDTGDCERGVANEWGMVW